MKEKYIKSLIRSVITIILAGLALVFTSGLFTNSFEKPTGRIICMVLAIISLSAMVVASAITLVIDIIGLIKKDEEKFIPKYAKYVKAGSIILLTISFWPTLFASFKLIANYSFGKEMIGMILTLLGLVSSIIAAIVALSIEDDGKVKGFVGKYLVYYGLFVYAAWIIFPFTIVLSTSFKTWQEAQELEFRWIPTTWSIDGYKDVFTYTTGLETFPVMIKGFMNTLMYIIPPTLLGLFTSSIAAFAFAKMNFKFKNALFTALLLTMLIPGTIMLTPSYVIYDMIGWTDSPLPLMIPGMFGAAACVFFMKQFYAGIPTELVEAAKLDGLGFFSIFWRIMVPLSIPALFAQGILGFVGGYNDYFGPLIYLQSPNLYTLQIALKSFSGTYSNRIPSSMAGTLIAMIPTIVIYLVAQKYFVEGIATSGMKL